MSDKPTAPSVPRLALRPREAAEALGISERKLRELLPRLPHLRLGSGRSAAVLIPLEGLRAWLEAQAQTPAIARASGEADEDAIAREELEKFR